MTVLYEEYSLNSWPALRTIYHHGWQLRFSEGFTKRSNSIQTIYHQLEPAQSLLPLVEYCERQYALAGQEVIFKITPFSPPVLDDFLIERGYELVDRSQLLLLEQLDDLKPPPIGEIRIHQGWSDEWLESYAQLTNCSTNELEMTKKLLSGAVLNHGFFTLYQDSLPAACGIAVIEEDAVGIYNFYTAEAHRNKGLGKQLLLHILSWAKANGATQSYLQVVANNQPALACYSQLGYKHLFNYWYRVKSL